MLNIKDCFDFADAEHGDGLLFWNSDSDTSISPADFMSSGTEADTEDYGDIRQPDNNTASSQHHYNTYDKLLAKTVLVDFLPENVKKIDIHLHITTTGAFETRVKVKVWNFNTSSWEEVINEVVPVTTETLELTGSLAVADPTDYVQGGVIYAYIYNVNSDDVDPIPVDPGKPDQMINIDYYKLCVSAIPDGEAGPTGATGADGEDGEIGPTGPTGATGANGNIVPVDELGNNLGLLVTLNSNGDPVIPTVPEDWSFGVNFGGSDVIPHGMKTDKCGFVYVVGTYSTAADVTEDTMVNIFSDTYLVPGTAGRDALFVMKTGKMGEVLWVSYSTGEGTSRATGADIDIDCCNNVYIVGSVYQDVVLSGNDVNNISVGYPTITTDSILIAKMDSNGGWLWAKTGGNEGTTDRPRGIAVDGCGHAYITGLIGGGGEATFDNVVIQLSALSANSSVFVVKYSAGGNALWGSSLACASALDSYIIAVTSIDIDGCGDPYIVGYFTSTSDDDVIVRSYENFPITEGNVNYVLRSDRTSYETYVAKLKNTRDQTDPIYGKWMWMSIISTDEETEPFVPDGSVTAADISIDCCNNIYVVGVSRSIDALYYRRFDYLGNIAISWDALDTIKVIPANVPTHSGWIARIDMVGRWLETPRFITPVSDHISISGVDIDNCGSVYVTGAFDTDITFAESTVTATGLPDVFVGKYNQDLTREVWLFTAHGAENNGNSNEPYTRYPIAVDDCNHVYIANATNSDPLSLANPNNANTIDLDLKGPAGSFSMYMGMIDDDRCPIVGILREDGIIFNGYAQDLDGGLLIDGPTGAFVPGTKYYYDKTINLLKPKDDIKCQCCYPYYAFGIKSDAIFINEDSCCPVRCCKKSAMLELGPSGAEE